MKGKFIIAVDLGGTNLKIGLLDLKFKIKEKKVLSTKDVIAKQALISAIVDSVKKLVVECGLGQKDILGVGLGLPGPVDYKKGIVHFLPNIPGWKEVGLSKIIRKKTGLAVFLDNDVNLMALAENKFGAAKKAKNAVCLTLGTGVGAGVIIEGRLYRGADNASGEIGHIPVNEEGPRCNCGGKACLEKYIGNNVILREARRIFQRNISLEELTKLAERHDKKAIFLWSQVARHLGVVLAGVVNLLNPDCIVIGGGVAGAGKILFDNVKKVISSRAMKVQVRRVKVFRTKLGNDAGLIGAAILVKESFAHS